MFSFKGPVLLAGPILACAVFISTAWPQPNPTTAASPAGNRVMPQVPATAAPTSPAPPPSTAAATSDLRIGTGDLLQIAVFDAPDFSREVRVSSSGEVSLPLIGLVRLAGLTTVEAEKLLERKLLDGGYFADPHVSVFAKEYQTQGISVLGEVQKPGIYTMLGSRRLFDVISAAGGTTPKAGNLVTITHRDPGSSPQTLALGGNEGNSTVNNPEVRPGDTIVVQKAGIVYVVGDVRMPGGFIMDKPALTVIQALAMAQGANSTASLDAARLIRRTGNQRQDVPIALKKILSSRAADIPMQPDDILFVPNSRAKTVMHRGVEAIVQAATGAAIYTHP